MRRFHLGWRLWLIGAATFILSQVGHIPFNALFNYLSLRGAIPAVPAGWRIPFNAAFLGLSAGLWEEGARYAVYRWWAKDARSWRKGLLFGAGHGGCEAILLGGMVSSVFIQMVFIRSLDLAKIVPPGQLAQAQQQVAAYWSMPVGASLLGAVERVFALACQLSLSILVLQVFTRRRFFWLGLAVFWHAVIDGVAVYGSSGWGAWTTEAIIAAMALVSLGIILILRQPEPAVAREGPG